MKLSNGTKKAQALLKRFVEENDLVDVYSEEFFRQQPRIANNPSATFTLKGFEYLLSEYENNPVSDLKPVGHLLFIHVDQYKRELRKALVDIYEPLRQLIDNDKHDPDFLIVNLYTRQILCIGLGRKNRLFAIDAETGKSINVFGLLEGLHAAGIFIERDNAPYMNNFVEHDVYHFVSDFVRALYKLGVAMYNYDSMLANQDQIEHSLELPPNDDGMYQLKDWDGCLIDDEEYTKDELVSMLNEIKSYQIAEDEAMDMINNFFPHCERGELNTGDY